MRATALRAPVTGHVSPRVMHPAEIAIIEVGKRYAAVGLQAAQAYNIEQAKLQLEKVLSQERLSSAEGTRLSLGSLADLERLTAAHKDTFGKVVVACTRELNAAMAELPAELQDLHRSGIVESVNWQLIAQSVFYKNRERWITAARGICELIDSHRSACIFSEAGVDFADDAHLARFGELLSTVEETHELEVKQLQERMDRLARSMATLGMGGLR